MKFLKKSVALCSLSALAFAAGCGRDDENASKSASVSAVPDAVINAIDLADIANLKFAASTPKGRKLFSYAKSWEKMQLLGDYKKHYPQAAMCATNLTEVFEEVFGRTYQSDNVPEFRRQIAPDRSPHITWFQGDSNASIVAKLNAFHSGLSGGSIKGTGYLPVGTVLGGCKASTGRNCDGASSDGHIGMIGDVGVYPVPGSTDVNVVYYFWNNNWLRDREGMNLDRKIGYDLGLLSKYFLPENYATLGYERHWMGVPVLDVKYNAAGRALSVKRLMPELDDVDLGNPEYETFLAVPQEIRAELESNDGVRLLTPPAPAKPRFATLKVATWIKKRPVQSGELTTNEKCFVTNPATVLAYTSRAPAAGDHVQVKLAFADASCPNMTGTVYLYNPHWTLTDK